MEAHANVRAPVQWRKKNRVLDHFVSTQLCSICRFSPFNGLDFRKIFFLYGNCLWYIINSIFIHSYKMFLINAIFLCKYCYMKLLILNISLEMKLQNQNHAIFCIIEFTGSIRLIIYAMIFCVYATCYCSLHYFRQQQTKCLFCFDVDSCNYQFQVLLIKKWFLFPFQLTTLQAHTMAPMNLFCTRFLKSLLVKEDSIAKTKQPSSDDDDDDDEQMHSDDDWTRDCKWKNNCD